MIKATFLSLENGIVNSSMKGGLGVLIRDLFLEAENEKLIFISPIYNAYSLQVLEGDSIVEISEREEYKDLNEEFRIKTDTCWYPAYLKVYSKSNGKSKAYFISFEDKRNEEWLRNLKIYGEADEGQLLFLRFIFANVSKEILKF